jgi:hypothetical protein
VVEDDDTPVEPTASLADGAVSWRLVPPFLEAVDREVGVARVNALLAAVGVDAEALRRRTSGWLPWAEYERVFDGLEPLVATGVARGAGRSLIDSPVLHFITLRAPRHPAGGGAARGVGRRTGAVHLGVCG